jgi:hypothetical protein
MAKILLDGVFAIAYIYFVDRENTLMTKTETRYFSGAVELRGSYPLSREAVRAQFPTGIIKRYDSFSLLVGTVDGKYSTSNFLPVTRIVHHNPKGSQHKCDGRCLNAKRGDCECSCGGMNHGAGN